MDRPPLVQRLLVLGGWRRVDEAHQPWLASLLAETDRQRLGLLLSAPNALIVAMLAAIGVGIAGPDLLPFLVIGPAVILATGLVPAFAKRRAELVAHRNGLHPPPW